MVQLAYFSLLYRYATCSSLPLTLKIDSVTDHAPAPMVRDTCTSKGVVQSKCLQDKDQGNQNNAKTAQYTNPKTTTLKNRAVLTWT